ncbi:MAG: phosphatase PAP2 family protein [Candidatus Dormibacteria bacterium]
MATAALGCSVVALAVLGLAVNGGALESLDHALLAAAQLPSGAALDWLMWAISSLGRIEVTVLAVLALALSNRSEGRFRPGWWVPLAAFVAATLVELGAKTLVHQPGPPSTLRRGPRLYAAGLETAFSFPSGHMTRLTLLLGIALARLRGRVSGTGAWAVLAVVVAVVGYSRVYLGEHWPTDVLGGILLGGAGIAGSLLLSPPVPFEPEDAARR